MLRPLLRSRIPCILAAQSPLSIRVSCVKLAPVPTAAVKLQVHTNNRPRSTMSGQQGVNLTGSCFCRDVKYRLHLNSTDDARTSLCHCSNCKKAFGGAFGLTSKVPLKAFSYDQDSKKPTVRCHFVYPDVNSSVCKRVKLLSVLTL
jgi:hypothetical protein